MVNFGPKRYQQVVECIATERESCFICEQMQLQALEHGVENSLDLLDASLDGSVVIVGVRGANFVVKANAVVSGDKVRNLEPRHFRLLAGLE